MKYKTAELTGALLDHAVENSGRHLAYEGERPKWSASPMLANIILSEGKIAVVPWTQQDGSTRWTAYHEPDLSAGMLFEVRDTESWGQQGDTWMEAVCRAEVASKLGEEVDLQAVAQKQGTP